MSDTYFDLPSRLEDSFPEIDSDIVTDLRKKQRGIRRDSAADF